MFPLYKLEVVMNYNSIAKIILKNIGGKDNVDEITHCTTRLRLTLNDNTLAEAEKIEEIQGVKGAFYSIDQLHIILGQGIVNKVYNEFINEIDGKIEPNKVSKRRKSVYSYFQAFSTMLSNIFTPIIPAVVASGLLMGLINTLTNFHLISFQSGFFVLLNMFSNAAFLFMPILIAYSAAKEFKTNPYLAVTLGAILVHPYLQDPLTLSNGLTNFVYIYDYKVDLIGYQGTVVPVLIAVWVMSKIEKINKDIVPEAVDTILSPFITLLSASFCAILVIGPAGRYIGDVISIQIQNFYNVIGPISGVFLGGIYSSIVVTGLHNSFHLIEVGLLSNPSIGVNFLLPIWSMANIAQGGAAFSVYLYTKDKKLKAIAAPAALSSLLGITEAAIFGVNLRLVKPFIAASIGGALGGVYITLTKVVMTGVGVTGIPGLAIVTQGSYLNYTIGIVISFTSSFIISSILNFNQLFSFRSINGRKEDELIYSVTNGRIIPLSEVPDKTFSTKILGDGVAIMSQDGKIYAPFNGKVDMIYSTKHAISMTSDKGTEVLIHIGLNSVSLNGEGFNVKVEVGNYFKRGDLMMEFSIDKLKSKDVLPLVIIVVTNYGDYETINPTNTMTVRNNSKLLKLFEKAQ